MAGTISTAKLKVSSSGAKGVAGQLDQVGKATERVGRAQTRLGQASAASGRQFAAQASGLGGLVAAYAGAAATVFALQAAFDALNKAARAETIIQGTKTLALEIGQSGPKILRQIKEITQGQIELSEAAQNINIALSSGFNTDQITRLTKVSLGASRALGRNLTDALQRVVRGAAKLEPELLDELGIFTRIDPAVEAYARKLGVAATQLTDFERRQAFVNAVITEGERKFSNIDTASASTQKSLEQLQTSIQELGLQFGQLVGKALIPLVNFFKNDFGNTLLLFGGILALVFGKASEIVGGFVAKTGRSLAAYADDLADKAALTDSTIKKINKTVTGQGIRSVQLRGQDPKQAAAFKAALESQRSGAIQTASQLNKVNQAYKEQQKVLQNLGKTGTKSYAALTQAIEKNGAELGKLDKRTLGYIGTSNLLNRSVTFLSNTFSRLLTVMNSLLIVVGIVQGVFSLFGIDVIGTVADFFDKLTKRSQASEIGLKSLGSTFGNTRDTILTYAKSIGATADLIEGIGSQVTNALSEVSKAGEAGVDSFFRKNKQLNIDLLKAKGITKALNDEKARVVRTDAERADQAANIANLERQLLDLNVDQLRTFAYTEKFRVEELKVREKLTTARINAISLIGDEAIQNKILIKTYENYLLNLQKLGPGLDIFIGQLSAATGIAGDEIIKVFQNYDGAFEKGATSITLFGKEIQRLPTGELDFASLTQNQQKFTTSATLGARTVMSLTEAFDAGALNADKLSQGVAGIQSQIDEILRLPAADRDESFLAKLIEDLINLESKRDVLRDTEAAIKGISKAFSGDLGKLSTGVFTGLVGLTGELAKNANEASYNQAQYLQRIIETYQEEAIGTRALVATNDERRKAGQELVEIDAQRLTNLQLFDTVIKAQAGRVITIFQEAQKVLKVEKERAVQLQNQLSALEDQQKLTELINNDRIADELARRTQQQQESALKLLDLQLQKQRQSVDLAEKQFKREKQIVQEVMSQEQTRANLADQQRQNAAAQASRVRQTQISRVGNEVSELESRAFVMSSELNDKKRELIELERQNAIATFEEQKKIEEKRTADALKMIDMREKLLNIEIQNTEKYLDSIKQSNTQELALFDKRTKQLADQAARDIANLERDREIGSQRNINALNAIDREEALFKQQSEQTIAQLKGFEVFAESVKALAAVAGPDSPLVTAFAGLLGITDKESAAALNEARKKALSEIPQITINRVQDAISQLQTNLDTQGSIFDKRRSDLLTNRQAESRLIDEQITSIQEKLQSEQAVRKLERDILSSKLLDKEREIQAEIDLQKQKLKGIPLERDEQRIKLTERINSLEAQRNQTLLELNNRYDTITRSENRLREAQFESQAIVKDSVTGAFMKLNDALIDGSITMGMVANTFKDMVGNMLREIQQAVFRKTIVDPIAEGIAGSLGKVVGLEDIAGQANEQAAAVTTQAAAATASTTIATSLATVGTSLTASSTTLATQVAAAIIPAQTALTTVGTQISLAINTMATQLQIAATTAQARIAAAVATATASSAISLPMAAGGKVKHFAGGGSNQLRDRVAAMLEPGEFVVRKEAAKMIGLSKLQQMNSGNANIFEMLGMNPVKKAGGGHPGLSDSSAMGTSGMAGSAGPGPGPGNPGFGQLGAANSSNANAFGGGAGKVSGSSFSSSTTDVSIAQVQAQMNMARKTGRLVGIVDALDTKPEREARAAQMSKNQADYKAEIEEKVAKAATAKAMARAKATAINFAFGLVPGVGQLHSAQSLFSGESIGKDMTGEEPFGLGDLFASGGSIRRMAGGGSVNTRDRVPALLEPGEFVIRRPMAKAIGGQALSQMNSTGRPPQISVNLNNSGAPKSVDVQPPKINGDKIILDIITRDMRNNGSMRKALRRGK